MKKALTPITEVEIKSTRTVVCFLITKKSIKNGIGLAILNAVKHGFANAVRNEVKVDIETTTSLQYDSNHLKLKLDYPAMSPFYCKKVWNEITIHGTNAMPNGFTLEEGEVLTLRYNSNGELVIDHYHPSKAGIETIFMTTFQNRNRPVFLATSTKQILKETLSFDVDQAIKLTWVDKTKYKHELEKS